MAKKKTAEVFVHANIQKTKHKDQPFTITIESQGPDLRITGRYSKLRAARKGAERKVRHHYPSATHIQFTLGKGLNTVQLKTKKL